MTKIHDMFSLKEYAHQQRIAAQVQLRRLRAKVKIMDALYDLHLGGDDIAVDIAHKVNDEIR